MNLILKTLAVIAAGVMALFGWSPPTTSTTAPAEEAPISSWQPRTPPGYGQRVPGSYNQGTSTPSTSPASADQSSGVVLIDTTVSFGMASAAGTGMVIDSSGVVVTNHHVVAGSTAVDVTVPATGQTYPAEVVGYDATADVAVLRLDCACDLPTVVTNTGQVSVGDTVTTVGNAQGGGQLVSSTGQISDTSEDITVTGDDGSQSDLADLIEVTANLVPGDSGGALLNASGEVVGMNVAGSSSTRVSQGYAIPITTVLDIAANVLAGNVTDTIAYGRTAALGVQVSTRSEGVLILGVIGDGPAYQAGITAGSTLTSLDGLPLASLDDLSKALADRRPGERAEVGWTDREGTAHSATVVLAEGPLA